MGAVGRGTRMRGVKGVKQRPLSARVPFRFLLIICSLSTRMLHLKVEARFDTTFARKGYGLNKVQSDFGTINRRGLVPALRNDYVLHLYRGEP